MDNITVNDRLKNQKTSSLGIVVYVIFFLINFVIGIITGNTKIYTGGLAVDLIILIGILRNRNKDSQSWAAYAAIRLLLGCLYVLIYLPIAHFSWYQFIWGVLWTIAAVGVAFLLLDRQKKIVRNIIYLICFIVGLSGLITGQAAIWPFESMALEHSIKKMSIGSAKWEDTENGVLFNLANSWIRLPIDNELIPIPNAKVIFAYPRKQYVIIILNEYLPDKVLGITSNRLSRYLDLVIENRKQQVSNLNEVSRTDVRCGPYDGCRSFVIWENQGNRYSGVITVFDDGWGYWIATLVSFLNAPIQSLSEDIEEFERSISSTRTLDDRITRLAEEVARDNRMYSIKAATIFLHHLQDKRYDCAEAASFGSNVIEKGIQHLSFAEKRELSRIYSLAWSSLKDDELSELQDIQKSYQQAMTDGINISEAETKRAQVLINKAIDLLSEKNRNRLQLLVEKAIVASLGDIE